LPANRSNRWWNLTNNGLTKADLTFKYVDGDIANGTESNYRAFRAQLVGKVLCFIDIEFNAPSSSHVEFNGLILPFHEIRLLAAFMLICD